jgi:hypothetical protein
MEKIIYTILEDGSYGHRPMTQEELKEHEAIASNPFPVVDRISPE